MGILNSFYAQIGSLFAFFEKKKEKKKEEKFMFLKNIACPTIYIESTSLV